MRDWRATWTRSLTLYLNHLGLTCRRGHLGTRAGIRRFAAKPNYPIESVDNVMKLLLMVANQKQVRVSDVSAKLGTAVSTAHRLLAMLAHHGVVVQNHETKAYEQRPVLLKLGLAAIRNAEVRVLLRPVIQGLRDDVGETVHLAVLRGRETLFIDCAESPVALRVASRVGTSMWAHCTASGKAWPACQSDFSLKELFPSNKLHAEDLIP